MSNKMLTMFSRITLFLAIFCGGIFSAINTKAQCCTYTLSMHDSYGDGWNGGQLEIFINNISIGIFSGKNYASVDTFSICNGDSLVLFYTAGMYENENSYELFDPAWNLIFDDGPTPQIDTVFNYSGNCNVISIAGSHPCNAIPIDTVNCIFADNSIFAGSGLNAGCADYKGHDMWFSMVVPPSGNISFSTDSGNINDTGIAAWTDSLCTNLKNIGCDDDGGPGYYSFLLLYDLTPGATVYIQVFGYGGGIGTFQLCAHDLGKVTLDSSELPIVIIHTQGQQIIEDKKINALMEIKYNGANNITYVNDSANIYNGNIGIEIRGATSASYPQRPYGLETRDTSGANNNVSIVGMPAENDWVLLSNFNDRSLIRNPLAFKLFGDMGNYSVRTQLCEVLVDTNYKGIYMLGEKIKRDSGRVHISKLTAIDTTGDELTGGYILQQNYWDATNSFQSNYSPIDHPTFDVHFVYEYPSADTIAVSQRNYIAAFIDSLEDALYSPNFDDTLIGFRKYLDVKSFIDYFLINELARSNDGFKKSVFFYKDKFSKGGKLKAGPVWDFDWGFKNLYGCINTENSIGAGWAHLVNDCPTDNYSTGWYIRMLQDSTFNNELRCTYENYRANILDTAVIFAYIDSVRNVVQNAQARHFRKWPILGISGPAPEINPIATTYNAELDTLKKWISIRLQWLDANIPGLCIPVFTSTNESNNFSRFNFFPNPTNGIVHFDGDVFRNREVIFRIYSCDGKLIEQKNFLEGKINFDFFLNEKGVFYFTFADTNGILQRGKIVVI